jgi:predicted transcriptional regulator of viral defense system
MGNRPNSQMLYDIVEAQAGYFTSKQAAKAGYSWERLSENTSSGKFQRIETGVYRLRQFPTTAMEEFFIALLKAGEKAVISHESALVVYDLSDVMPGIIHVTIPRTSSRRRNGLQFHTKQISEDEVTVYSGLRVTNIPRTIIDLLESGCDFGIIKDSITQAAKRGMVSYDEIGRFSIGKSKKIIEQINQIIDGGNG